jgi:vanillate O-demethylase monooxygenase subunit
MFLRNSWYVAAWDREIGRRPLARMILGEPIVLYR